MLLMLPILIPAWNLNTCTASILYDKYVKGSPLPAIMILIRACINAYHGVTLSLVT